MTLWLKALRPHGCPKELQIDPMELDRDYPEIDRLFAHEEWPFLRSDLELSHAQPKAAAFVARRNGVFAGFFAAHAFGPIGYWDMMIIDPAFRKQGVTRHLFFRTLDAMEANGIHAFVVHTTNDSAPLIKFLGFLAGQNFTLLRREPLLSGGAQTPARADDLPVPLTSTHRASLMALDAEVFGMRRDAWFAALLAQPAVQCFGSFEGNRLIASVCLRQRKHNALCLDTANASTSEALEPLIHQVLARYPDRRLECFARTGSPLHRLLEQSGFVVPEFFKAIGPLIEWRMGNTGAVGLSEQIQTLNWF